MENNQPIYKISGIERRRLKKDLSELKSFVKYFWHYHKLDKDMTQFYGGNGDYPMDDIKAKNIYDRKNDDIQKIQDLLDEKLV